MPCRGGANGRRNWAVRLSATLSTPWTCCSTSSGRPKASSPAPPPGSIPSKWRTAPRSRWRWPTARLPRYRSHWGPAPRSLASVTVFVTIVIMIANYSAHIYTGFTENFRYDIFQTVAIQTTTGYGTADFDTWPNILRLGFVILMFFGGCAGSTGGGMKHVRLLLLWRYFKVQMVQLVHPRAVSSVKLQGERVSNEVMQSILGFFFLAMFIFIVSSLALAAQGLDIVTATSAVAATLHNIGPGLGKVGSTCNYGHLPDFSKILLSFCMLIGRLELYTVVILLTPAYWRECKAPCFSWNQKTKCKEDEE